MSFCSFQSSCESLGIRICGGVSSDEGDIPIYIANMDPEGPVGKSKSVKVCLGFIFDLNVIYHISNYYIIYY